MSNNYIKSLYFWKTGHYQQSIECLNNHLEYKLGQPAFTSHPNLLKGKIANFEGVLSILCSNSPVLIAPFASVFYELWLLHPSSYLIAILKAQNFFYHPPFPYDSETLKELGLNIRIQSSDTEMYDLAKLLGSYAKKGLLSNSIERFSSGRISLRMEELTLIPELKWGNFKKYLLENLADSYLQCPKEFWYLFAVSEPLELFFHFLHHTFIDFNPTKNTVILSIASILKEHKDYTEAIKLAFEYILTEQKDITWYQDVIKYDMGLSDILNPTDFFYVLYQTFNTQNIDQLERFLLKTSVNANI